MAQPYLPVTNKKTGKTYQYPITDVTKKPTKEEVRQFIFQQENKSTWQKANERLTDLPAKVGRAIAEPIYRYGEGGEAGGPPKPFYHPRRMAQILGAFTEGVGETVADTTSPMGIATTVATPGLGAAVGKMGAPAAGKAIAGIGRLAGGAQVLHGGGSALGEIAEDPLSFESYQKASPYILEAGLGALGARGWKGGQSKFRSTAETPPVKATVPLSRRLMSEVHDGSVVEPHTGIGPRPPAGLGRGDIPDIEVTDMGPYTPSKGLPSAPSGRQASPSQGPFFGGRRGVSQDIEEVTDFARRSRTPEEEAFNALVPERYKPSRTLESMSDEGLTGTSPYEHVPQSPEGNYPPGPEQKPATPQQRKGFTKKTTAKTALEQAQEENPIEGRPFRSAFNSLKSIFEDVKTGNEKGEIDLRMLVPESIEDMLLGVKKKVGDWRTGAVKAGKKVNKEFDLPDRDPLAGFYKSGWAEMEEAGPAGKKLARLLSRARLDAERQAEKIGDVGKLGGKIYNQHKTEIEDLISQIPENHRGTVNEIVQYFSGAKQPAKPSYAPAIKALKTVEAFTKLSQFVISNTSALATNFMQGNTGATIGAMGEVLSDYKGAVERARKSGALRPLIEEITKDIPTEAGKKGEGILSSMYFIKRSEEAMRTVAATSGRRTAKELFDQIRANPNKSSLARKRLDNLVLENVDEVMKQGSLTTEQLDRAASRFSEITQGRAENIDLPSLWTGHPAVDLATQFKRYAFVQTRNMKNAFKQDPVRAGAALAVAFPIIGELVGSGKAVTRGIGKSTGEALWGGKDWSADGVKEAIKEEWENRGEGMGRYFNNISAAWGFGLFGDYAKAAERGPWGLAKEFVGPAMGDISEAGYAGMQALKGKYYHAGRQAARAVPYVGTGLAASVKGSYKGKQRRRKREKRSSRD